MRPFKLTPEQHKLIRERHLLYLRFGIEAAKHSTYALAKELGVAQSTVRDYLNRKIG